MAGDLVQDARSFFESQVSVSLLAVAVTAMH